MHLLKSLLGKARRAIVVDGRLLSVGNRQVLASLNNYRVEFTVVGSQTPMNQDAGVKLIMDRLHEFNSKYGRVLQNQEQSENLEAFIDAYTGAVVIESAAFRMFYDRDVHSLDMQHSASVAELVRQFIEEYTSDYFDLYQFLFHRRIAAQHMSMMIRSHFTNGFYQPLIVQSQGVLSPMSFGENEWFVNMFAGVSKSLEHASDSARRLELSCVASCDIATLVGCPVIPQLDRRYWMALCTIVQLDQLNKEAARAFMLSHGTIFRDIRENDGMREMWSRMQQYSDKIRKGLRVI